MPKIKKLEVELEYQNYILSPPVAPKSLYETACGADGKTIDVWRETWLKNIQANKKTFGSFASKSIGQLHRKYKYRPAIVAGAGPSLKRNASDLKGRGDIPLISCLHNFHFLEDQGTPADFYVTLDAGEVTIEEVSEGGTRTEEEYWAITKGRTLLAYIGTSPRLLEKWQGEIYFYNCPTSDHATELAVDSIEKFHMYVSPGGNVLGACLYIAKGIFGANPIAFVGADFCFSYDKKFHGWDSKYDKDVGHVMRSVDVFGNKVYTWGSYHGFKCFFDWVTQVVPGSYYNCTEGGTFGAYPEGNIISVKQLDLTDFIKMYEFCEEIQGQCLDPEGAERLILY
jgi:hypothetical protein